MKERSFCGSIEVPQKGADNYELQCRIQRKHHPKNASSKLRNQETGFVCCTILNRLYTQNQKNPADAQGDSLKQKTCVFRAFTDNYLDNQRNLIYNDAENSQFYLAYNGRFFSTFQEPSLCSFFNCNVLLFS